MEVMRVFLIIVAFFLYCGSVIAGFGDMTLCYFKECCTDNYIPADLDLLNELLSKNLYGQHLAHETVLHALRHHIDTKESKKALAMSFHGLPGTGKNYMSEFIVKALYKEGVKSNYVHFYNGLTLFQSEVLIEQNQAELQQSITKHLKACPRSIFIFDGVDTIPKGILDALLPFLDFYPTIPDIDTTQAIFIFMSNTGGTEIANYMLEMWQNGKSRKQIRLQDFEQMLSFAAFNDEYGFHKNKVIKKNLIDYYVPFIPLEKEHVRQCIVDAFRRRKVEPNSVQIEKAISQLTFGPTPHNLYSTVGCKRLDQKIAYIINDDLQYNKENSQQSDNTKDRSSTVEERIDKIQDMMESMTKMMETLGGMVKENNQELANIKSNLVTHKREIDTLKSQSQKVTKRKTVEVDEL